MITLQIAPLGTVKGGSTGMIRYCSVVDGAGVSPKGSCIRGGTVECGLSDV